MQEPEEFVVWCWGCTKLILVPLVESTGLPAELFKCGWCGAVNDLKQQPLSCVSPAEPGSAQQPPHHHNHHQQQQQQQQQAPTYDYYTQQQQQWQQQQQQQWHNNQPSLWPPPQQQQGASSTSTSKSSAARRRRCLAVTMSAVRWLAVVLVLVLIFSVAGCGVVTLLPLVCSSWSTYLPNLVLALLLVFQVLFNYAAAVLTPAGRVSDYVSPPARTADGCVPQGSLQHWSWCRHCAAAKPPSAHHCSVCKVCVMHLDHHCPLLANCVGQGNLRVFLLFLLWTLLAAGYALCMCSLLTWLHWGEVKAVVAGRSSRQHHTGGAQHSSMQPPQVLVLNAGAGGGGGSSGNGSSAGWVAQSQLPQTTTTPTAAAAAMPEVWLFATTGIFFLVLQASPWWMLAAYYLVATSLGIVIAIGMLLISQLYYLGLGVSYVDHLKAVQASGGSVSGAAGAQSLSLDVGEQPRGRWARFAARMEVTWVRWWEVVGGGQSAGSKLAALLFPRWRPLPPVSSGGVKKWS